MFQDRMLIVRNRAFLVSEAYSTRPSRIYTCRITPGTSVSFGSFQEI